MAVPCVAILIIGFCADDRGVTMQPPAVSLVKEPRPEADPLLQQTRLSEAQAASQACISMACETPDAALTVDEQVTVRVDGVVRVLPVKRCTPCSLKLQGMRVIVGETGGRP
jgi:hypothetical protein